MKRFTLACLVFASLVAGCDETVYKIALTPKGDKVLRKLTVVRTTSRGEAKALDKTEMAEIVKAYSQSKQIDPARHEFSGTFGEAMPADLGNFGRYIRSESDMGEALSYFERFRGNSRPAEAIADSMKAVDELVDILIGYLETRIGLKPGFKALRKFMDTEFRKDLKNICVYTYLMSSPSRLNWLTTKKDDRQVLEHESFARIAAYLVEQGYVKARHVPEIGIGFTSQKSFEASLERLLKSVGRKAEIPNSKLIPHLLALLLDDKTVSTTFEAYIKTTPQYKKAVKKPRPADDKDGNTKTSATELVLKPILERAVHLRLNIFGGSLKLDLKLALGVKPDATNGKWDAKEKTVSWTGELTPLGKSTTRLPEICYALWTKPDADFQKGKFGKVVFNGSDLAHYCIWRNGLTQDEAARWEAALARHKPGADIEKAFTDSDKSILRIAEGMDMLRRALESKTRPGNPEK